MAAYRWVYDSSHLQADCQELGSALEPYAWQSSTGNLFNVCNSYPKDGCMYCCKEINSAASLTVDWQRRVLVSVMGWVPAPVYWGPVAELQPSGRMSGIPIGHTQSIANSGVLAVTQHRVHENHCGNLAAHTHGNRCSDTSVAVLAHSAAELVENDFHRPQAISNLASNFLC